MDKNAAPEKPMWFKVVHGVGCLVAVLFFLYFFLVGLDIMGNAFKILAGDSAGTLFQSVSNPIAGLMVGVLATVLVQSSSTTTSIIVAAVGSGALPVQTAIPMIFGANIGTSVTNTIVSIGFAGNVVQYERGFAGATVHDIFNLMNVLFWLPVELISSAINGGNGGVLFLISEAIAGTFDPCDDTVTECESWTGPLKKITSVVSKAVISVDKDVIKDFANGRPEESMCEFLCDMQDCVYKFARKKCTEFLTAEPSTICGGEGVDDSEKAKFIFCTVGANVTGTDYIVDEAVLTDAQAHFDAFKLNKGGALYDAGWSDNAAGAFTLVVSLIVLVICLVGLVKVLTHVLSGTAERVIKKALDINGYLAILVGTGITIFVQSSSITTSILTPLVAVGVLELDKMLPLTLGANIGTTITGILASLVGNSVDGFQIAIVHVFFNLFGVVMFYPIPMMRQIPLSGARVLGKIAASFRPFPVLYIVMVFLIYPGILLGLSLGFESGEAGPIVAVTLVLIALVALHGYAIYWFKYKGGKAVILAWIEKRGLDLKGEDEDLEKSAETGAEEVEGSKEDAKVTMA